MEVRVLQINGYAIAGVELSCEQFDQDITRMCTWETIIFYAQNRLVKLNVTTTEAADMEEYDEEYVPEFDCYMPITKKWHQDYSQKVREIERISDYCTIPEFDEIIDNYNNKTKHGSYGLL